MDAISSRSPRSVEDIASRCGLSVATVTAVLGAMELEGLAAETDRGWTRRQ